MPGHRFTTGSVGTTRTKRCDNLDMEAITSFLARMDVSDCIALGSLILAAIALIHSIFTKSKADDALTKIAELAERAELRKPQWQIVHNVDDQYRLTNLGDTVYGLKIEPPPHVVFSIRPKRSTLAPGESIHLYFDAKMHAHEEDAVYITWPLRPDCSDQPYRRHELLPVK